MSFPSIFTKYRQLPIGIYFIQYSGTFYFLFKKGLKLYNNLDIFFRYSKKYLQINSDHCEITQDFLSPVFLYKRVDLNTSLLYLDSDTITSVDYALVNYTFDYSKYFVSTYQTYDSLYFINSTIKYNKANTMLLAPSLDLISLNEHIINLEEPPPYLAGRFLKIKQDLLKIFKHSHYKITILLTKKSFYITRIFCTKTQAYLNFTTLYSNKYLKPHLLYNYMDEEILQDFTKDELIRFVKFNPIVTIYINGKYFNV